ncbi:isopenicillin N synthase family dioxygenase [Aspergillus ibericus CBS 121593]|uniref:Clavaminate synthase-like protein n=1 Tax=Aspergillus ibericus CBS 121593 TaxID=1448316 RepID=A0A395GU96_9EURO|nr:Clavaminate synthase-like protein [Aspergillus ibericus CBS 121593]RAK98992.1 Clavaminate synthase-like protein [Aspergillus ibericus CBS 121593]
MAPGRIDPPNLPTSKLEIPSVDISAFLADPDSPEAQRIVPIVRQACRTTGFFQVTGHGVSPALQKAVFEGGKKFFALPFETKNSFDSKKVRGHRGYDVLASQSYEPGILPDLKEGWYVGEDLPDEDPRVQAGRFFMGSNVWPDEAQLARQDFRNPCEEYHRTLSALSVRILQLIERTLPYGSGIFDDFVSNNPITPMRILHYPPARTPTDKPQFGASAHTDFGAITLLLQDESPGLEVLDSRTGTWVGVPPNPNAYVVNIGDMLSRWTKNEYVSSVHRVINQNPWDRYSIVFFFDGNADTELRALDGSEAEDPNPLTPEKHMLNRMTESYGKKKTQPEVTA